VEYKLIIIRYGEIGLKAKETRSRFENILINNIKNVFDQRNYKNKIKKEKGRIFLYTSKINECVAILQKIFGITSISPAVSTTNDLGCISGISVNLSKEILNLGKSFAIKVTRIGKHNYTSQDVAIKTGNDIVKATHATVNLTSPDFKLCIEIRDKDAYIFTDNIRGIGGLPFGTQGNALILFEDAKSLLAAWYLMRRGCKIIFIITKKRNIESLKSFLTRWYIRTDIIWMNSSVKNIYTFFKNIASEKNCDAIVMSNKIFNNPSVELSNIKLFKKYTNLTILNPLIAMDDIEINQRCKDLGIPL